MNWFSLLGSAGLSGLGAGFDFWTSKRKAKQQYKYATKLNEQQFGYQQQLAADAHDYQKDLAEQQFDYQGLLADKQFGFQQRLQQSQNDFNLDMWNKANDYNSPAAQAQRFSEAGFNPALMMGGSAISPTVSSASPNFNMPSSSMPSASLPSSPSASFNMPSGLNVVQGLVGLMDSISDLEIKQEQKSNLAAETALKIQQSGQSVAQTKLLELQGTYQQIVNNWGNLSEEQRIEQLKAATANLRENSLLTESQAKQIETMLPKYAALTENQISELKAKVNLIAQQSVTEVAKRYNLNASATAALHSALMYDASALQSESQVELNNALTDNERYKAQDIIQDAQLKYQQSLGRYLENNYLDMGMAHNSSLTGSLMNLLGAGGRYFGISNKIPSTPSLTKPQFNSPIKSSGNIINSALGSFLYSAVKDLFSSDKKSYRNPQMKKGK